MALRTLICDDEESICALLHDILLRFGIEAVLCHDGPSALARAERESFGLFFLDIRMPGMDGVELLRRLRQIHPDAKYVMITGYAHDDMLQQSEEGGAYALLAKPFSLVQLKKLLAEVGALEPART